MEPITTTAIVALVKEQVESGILDSLKEKATDEIIGVLVKNALKMTSDANNQGWWKEKAKWFTNQEFAHDWITKSIRRILDSECNLARAIIERVYMRCLIEERDLSYEERVIVKGCPQLTDRQINMLVILLKAKFPGEAISMGEFEGNIWAYKKDLEGLSGLEKGELFAHMQGLKNVGIVDQPVQRRGGEAPAGDFRISKITRLFVSHAREAEY